MTFMPPNFAYQIGLFRALGKFSTQLLRQRRQEQVKGYPDRQPLSRQRPRSRTVTDLYDYIDHSLIFFGFSGVLVLTATRFHGPFKPVFYKISRSSTLTNPSCLATSFENTLPVLTV